jgi:hypothetical protein
MESGHGLQRVVKSVLQWSRTVKGVKVNLREDMYIAEINYFWHKLEIRYNLEPNFWI